MQTVGIYVTLRIPDNMTPEQAVAEVKTSIGFGQQLEVSLQFVVPDAPSEPDGVVVMTSAEFEDFTKKNNVEWSPADPT